MVFKREYLQTLGFLGAWMILSVSKATSSLRKTSNKKDNVKVTLSSIYISTFSFSTF